MITGMKTKKQLEDRIEVLEGERGRLRAYMADKERADDWHGVQDAASDLRELDVETKVLRWIMEL